MAGDAHRIQSLTALDGAKIGGEIRRRLKLYRQGFAVLAALAALCLFLGTMLYLPPAGENTAFENIALTGAAQAWAQEAGLTVIHGPPLIGAVFLNLLLPALLAIAIVAVFARRHVGLLVFPLIAFFLYWQHASLFFIDHSELEIARAQVTPALVAGLEQDVGRAEPGAAEAAGSGPARPSPGMRPSSPGAVGAATGEAPLKNKLVYPSWHSAAGAEARLPSGDAAYVLAQIAYIDGRVADTAQYLPAALWAVETRGTAHQQRFDIMREWVETQRGTGMSLDPLLRHLLLPMAFARTAAVPVIVLGAVAAGLASAMIALFLIGRRRVTRISRLVGEVQAMRAASAATAGDEGASGLDGTRGHALSP